MNGVSLLLLQAGKGGLVLNASHFESAKCILGLILMGICSGQKLSPNYLNVALFQVLPQLGHLIGSLLVQLNLVEGHYAKRCV